MKAHVIPKQIDNDRAMLKIINLKIKLANTNSQIGALKVRVEEYNKRFDELSRLVDEIPEIEAQYSALNRDYDITKSKYADLLSRRESATISESVNKTTDGVQFNVVEPPRVGLKPIGPNRILLSSIIIVLGLAAGIAFAFVCFKQTQSSQTQNSKLIFSIGWFVDTNTCPDKHSPRDIPCIRTVRKAECKYARQ